MGTSEEGIPACSMVEVGMHFLERGQWAQSKVAKKICAGCLVKNACLETGLHEPYGIWGGLDRRERERECLRRLTH